MWARVRHSIASASCRGPRTHIRAASKVAGLYPWPSVLACGMWVCAGCGFVWRPTHGSWRTGRLGGLPWGRLGRVRRRACTRATKQNAKYMMPYSSREGQRHVHVGSAYTGLFSSGIGRHFMHGPARREPFCSKLDTYYHLATNTDKGKACCRGLAAYQRPQTEGSWGAALCTAGACLRRHAYGQQRKGSLPKPSAMRMIANLALPAVQPSRLARGKLPSRMRARSC